MSDDRTYTAAEVAAAVAAEREAIKALILGGNFLHNEAPTARFASDVCVAIDRARTGTDALAAVRAEARREAMRDAARAADAKAHHMLPLTDAQWNTACRSIAAAIRALIEEPRDAG